MKCTIHRMEEALIEMKKRNDELMRGNKDAIDSPTSPKFYSTNNEVLHLKEELKRREAAHTERIVEMVSNKSTLHPSETPFPPSRFPGSIVKMKLSATLSAMLRMKNLVSCMQSSLTVDNSFGTFSNRATIETVII